MLDISLLFLWFINLRSHHWGGHHLAVVNHRFPQSYSHLMPFETQLQDHLLMLSDPLRNLFGDSGHVMRIVNCCVQQHIGMISCSKQHALSRSNLKLIIWKMSDVRWTFIHHFQQRLYIYIYYIQIIYIYIARVTECLTLWFGSSYSSGGCLGWSGRVSHFWVGVFWFSGLVQWGGKVLIVKNICCKVAWQLFFHGFPWQFVDSCA